MSYTKISSSEIQKEYDIDTSSTPTAVGESNSAWIASKMWAENWNAWFYLIDGGANWEDVSDWFKEDDPVEAALPPIDEYIYCQEAGKGVLLYLAHEMMSWTNTGILEPTLSCQALRIISLKIIPRIGHYHHMVSRIA